MAETNISDPQPTELPQEDCRTFHGDLDWYHFLLTSIGTWLGAALIVLIPRLIYAPLKVTSVIKLHELLILYKIIGTFPLNNFI